MSRSHQTGFTLLEILVAISIFAILAVLAYGGLNSIVRAQLGLRVAQTELNTLDLALSRFEKDLRQALPRAARGAYGTEEAALVGDSSNLSLSTLSLAAAANGPALRAVRVRHAFAAGRWLRAEAAALDVAPNTPESARLQLDGFNNARLRYLDNALIEQSQWPPVNASQNGLSPNSLPRAVELRIDTKAFGEVRRVIALNSVAPRS
jgi:general secretion pathway protein J